MVRSFTSVVVKRCEKRGFLVILYLFMVTCPFLRAQETITDDLVNALKTGSSVTLSQYFDANIALAIMDQDDIYSKQQAELILKNFFTKNTPSNFVILHRGATEESEYAIGNLSTSNGNFRVTLYIKRRENKPFVHRIWFEQEDAD